MLPGTTRGRPAAARRSPFRPGTPLYVGDLLPGPSRRALVATICDDASRGQNVNLVGDRRTGRTTTLNHAWGRLTAADRVVARVNMQADVVAPEQLYGAILVGISQCPLGADVLGRGRSTALARAPEASYAEVSATLRELREQTTAIVLVDEFERCFDLPDAFTLPVFYDNLVPCSRVTAAARTPPPSSRRASRSERTSCATR